MKILNLPAKTNPVDADSVQIIDSAASGLSKRVTWASLKSTLGGELFDKGAQVYNVKAYGAVADGSTDDSAAIQAAITAVASRGGIVYLPPGSYAVASTITIDKPITFKGAGFSADTNNVNNAAWLPATELKWTGATANKVSDGAMTSGSATLTSATAAFVAGDVGKWIIVDGAGFDGTPLHTKITARTNGTTVTLGETAGTTVSGATIRYGHPVIQVNSSYVSSSTRGAPVGSAQVLDLGIDGNALAFKGVACDRLQSGAIANIGVKNLHATAGIGLHCFTMTGIATTDFMHNRIESIAVRASTLIRLDGSPVENSTYAASLSNVAHNKFSQLFGVFTENGIWVFDADNNTFDTMHLYRASGSGYGVVFEANARANYFFDYDGNSGLLAKTPNVNFTNNSNLFFGYDRENGQPAPVLQAGASLDWTETGNNADGWTAKRIAGEINVKALGAVGDGANDDTAALQAAITLMLSRGGVIRLPPGQYKITSPLLAQSTSTAQKQSITLEGAGFSADLSDSTNAQWQPATEIIYAGSAPAQGVYAPMIQIGGDVGSSNSYVPMGGLQIRNLALNGNRIATHGILADRLQFSKIENVGVRKLDGKGAWVHGTNDTSPAVTNPAVAPTVSAGGSGSTLTAGTYYVKYAWNSTSGETLPSPESLPITVTAGQAITVTIPSLPTNAVSANIYLSDAGGVPASCCRAVINAAPTSVVITANPVKGAGLHLHTTGAADDDCRENVVDTFFAGVGVATAIRQTGNVAHNANSAHNAFRRIQCIALGDAMVVDDADNNGFYDVFVYRPPQITTGYALDLGTYARGNYFYHLESGGGGIFVRQPASHATASNIIYGYDRENGQPDPTLFTNTAAPTATPSASGGSLATNTYYYRIGAYEATGKLLALSAPIRAAVTGPTGSVAFSGYSVTGATSYRIFRGTAAGAETSYYDTTSTSYTDTGATITGTATAPASISSSNLTFLEDGRNSTGWKLLGPNVKVGICSPSPGTRLDVGGAIRGNGLVSAKLATPAAPTVIAGTTGAVAYGYKITARTLTGETAASAETVIANGAATANNTITWARVDGATDYRIWRTTAGGTGNSATTGLIGTLTEALAAALTFTDSALAATGTAPVADTTHRVGIGTAAPLVDLHVTSSDLADVIATVQAFGSFKAAYFNLDSNHTQFYGYRFFTNNGAVSTLAWQLGNAGGNANDCNLYVGGTAWLTWSASPAGLLGIGGAYNASYGLYLNGGNAKIAALTNPSAPNTPTTSTSGGSIAAGTYFYAIIAEDRAGNKTLASAASASVTTTGATSTNTVTWTAVPGAAKYYVLRNTSSTVAANTQVGTVTATAQAGTPATFTDTFAAANTAITLPTRNATGDAVVDGNVTFGPASALAVGSLYVSTASVTVATNSTATLIGSGVGTLTLPANYLIAGRTVRLRAKGYITTTASPSTLIFLAKLGSTTIANTNNGTAVTPTASMTAKPWEMDLIITCRSVGASGTVMAVGRVGLATSNTVNGTTANWDTILLCSTATPANVTIDTTASQAIDFQVTDAGTGSTVVCTNFTVEVMN